MSFLIKAALWLALAIVTFGIAYQADATTIPATSKLEAGQVVPPTTSLGFGTGTLVYDTISHILTWSAVITDVLFDSPEVGSSINGPAAVGFTAPSLVSLGVGSLKLGSVDLDDICLNPTQCESDLLASLWYMEVATEGNPSGEIRGQIVPILPLPEAAVTLMLGAGLLGLAAVGRGRIA